MRISRDQWALQLAEVTARRSTCCRRAVGCVLIDGLGHVLATGYNGVAAGLPHCNELTETPVYNDDPRVEDKGTFWLFNNGVTDKMRLNFGDRQCVGFDQVFANACAGAQSPSGTNLDACQAIHAEQNALLQCRDVQAIAVCYTTCSPCMTCVKLLLNTSCGRLVFSEMYPHTEALDLWRQAGRSFELLPGLQKGG